ncbi:hypothetical protein AAY473_008999 [Plecturocebus cupreus]
MSLLISAVDAVSNVFVMGSSTICRPCSNHMGSCYVAQAGFELLGSSNPPTLASQSTRIIEVFNTGDHSVKAGMKVKVYNN